MANEIHVDYTSGNTLYAVVRNTAGEVWYAGGQVFESWGTGSRAADDYDISLTDKSGNRYVGSFDSNIPAGRYSIQIFSQAGANPADSDNLVGGGEIVWSGVGEVTSDKLLANKAVQNKSTGEIKYYDNDGQTVLLTHTPTDAAATITRTLS
jgi:ABC-type molybdate transport system substrate-binding protein